MTAKNRPKEPGHSGYFSHGPEKNVYYIRPNIYFRNSTLNLINLIKEMCPILSLKLSKYSLYCNIDARLQYCHFIS